GRRGVGRQGLHCPLAIHLAETEAETQLLQDRSGPFIDFLTERGALDKDGLASSYEAILRPFRHTPWTSFVHGNYLPQGTDLGMGTLIYCPRTPAAFGHKPHPFRDFLARRLKVALGTDGSASNPALAMLNSCS